MKFAERLDEVDWAIKYGEPLMSARFQRIRSKLMEKEDG